MSYLFFTQFVLKGIKHVLFNDQADKAAQEVSVDVRIGPDKAGTSLKVCLADSEAVFYLPELSIDRSSIVRRYV